MGTQILTFHHQEPIGNETRIGPTYYIEADYTPVAVRIHAETAPTRDAKVDIFDDGVSIFQNRTPTVINRTTGRDETDAAVTEAVLATGENLEESAEDFSTSLIEEGSLVHCNLVDAGGGRNFTVQLELYSSDEVKEESD